MNDPAIYRIERLLHAAGRAAGEADQRWQAAAGKAAIGAWRLVERMDERDDYRRRLAAVGVFLVAAWFAICISGRPERHVTEAPAIGPATTRGAR